MDTIVIESAQNLSYKRLVALKNKKERDETNSFVVEGESFVRDILNKTLVKYYVFSRSFAEQNDISSFVQLAKKSFVLSDNLFKSACDTLNPQGILAVCQKFPIELFNVSNAENGLIIFCENVADPGNLGTIIRTAAAANCVGVVLSAGCADLYNPKTVRATAGALFAVPITVLADVSSTLDEIKLQGFQIFAAHLKGNVFHFEANLRGKCCLLIGNEANGLSETAAQKADVLVKIPMNDCVESLNVSVASGILAYEYVRQNLQI